MKYLISILVWLSFATTALAQTAEVTEEVTEAQDVSSDAATAQAPPAPAPEPPFSNESVLLYEVARQLGHAVIREFDLPILGPEEALVDDFATIMLYQSVPDTVADIISDYIVFLDAKDDVISPFSEYYDHNRRGARAVCLLYGIDAQNFEDLADANGLSGDAARDCRSAAPEVLRSWRRILAPLEIPADARAIDVRMRFEDADLARAVINDDVVITIQDMVARFDWHSSILIAVRPCDGVTGWSRNGRAITICEPYLQPAPPAQ